MKKPRTHRTKPNAFRNTLLSVLLLSSSAAPHTRLSSRAELTEIEGGYKLDLVFASTESFPGIALDDNGDGFVTASEVFAKERMLSQAMGEGIRLRVEGVSCEVQSRKARLTEEDGLLFELVFSCEGGEAHELSFDYLSGLSPEHRMVVRFVADHRIEEKRLDPIARTFAFVTKPPPRAPRRPAFLWALALLAFATLGFLLLSKKAKKA